MSIGKSTMQFYLVGILGLSTPKNSPLLRSLLILIQIDTVILLAGDRSLYLWLFNRGRHGDQEAGGD